MKYTKDIKKVFQLTQEDRMAQTNFSDCHSCKTFFIQPEITAFPEDVTQTFFLNGFEVYTLFDAIASSLISKIHLLYSLFPNLILFINVDRRTNDLSWPSVIEKLKQSYGDRAKIGIMYQKRNSDAEIQKIENEYPSKIGVNCGKMALEYNKMKNLTRFLFLFAAIHANDKRKNIRILCSDLYKMTFVHQGQGYHCSLKDLSTSHYTVELNNRFPNLLVGERLYDVQLNLRGVICNVNSMLCLKRQVGEKELGVFVFRNETEKDGLSDLIKERVNTIIFDTLQKEMEAYLKQIFDAERLRTMAARQTNFLETCGCQELPNIDVEKLLAGI